MKDKAQDLGRGLRTLQQLESRLHDLEAEVQECRQANLRMAELVDVVAELLLPVAQQDQERISETLARYHQSVGGPQG